MKLSGDAPSPTTSAASSGRGDNPLAGFGIEISRIKGLLTVASLLPEEPLGSDAFEVSPQGLRTLADLGRVISLVTRAGRAPRSGH